jgi:predicted GH43/DUF377 family glycosyl hydrolase
MHLFSKTDQKWGSDNDPKMKEEKEKAAVFHTQISKSSSTSKKKKKHRHWIQMEIWIRMSVQNKGPDELLDIF